MFPPIPIGIDDFRAIRELGLAYVDKSSLIRELLDRPGVQVVLLPRPRRFGKTVNLSMLRCWFEKREEDFSPLFHDLSIWQAGDPYRAHFQRYPVIAFNFKDTKGETFEACWSAIRGAIQVLFDQHRSLLDSEQLSDLQRRSFQAILDGSAEPSLYRRALLELSDCLRQHHGQPVVILIDEYDTPIHTGYLNGYAPQILDFMRGFLGAALKSNPHLHRAVLTGILKIAKESLFSDVNNIGVFTLLSRPFRTCFGFTEPEVIALLDRTGKRHTLDAVRAWYNGYLFGGEVIYNPWSVASFLDSEIDSPRAYWLATSSNALVRQMLERHALTLQPIFESLLEGGSFERELDDNVVLDEVGDDPNALFSLLVFSGYLKARQIPGDPERAPLYQISIPNLEVRQLYATTFTRWMEARLRGHGGSLEKLSRALLEGDAELLEDQLQAFVINLLSYQDAGSVDPEGVYHGFVLGLLAAMEPAYRVRSNRESGLGRPDLTIAAREPGKPAAVLELKVARKGRKTPTAALEEGEKQILERGYEAELLAGGASVVRCFAVAFDGKRAWVRGVEKKAGRKKAGRQR
jgi:hypothetical protein